MKILLSGGGTLGPVIPLLAIAEAVAEADPKAQFVWVGTKNGPERAVVAAAGMQFATIGAGKWRRYFSLLNIFDILRIVLGFFKSIGLIIKHRPTAVVSAGGYVSVPLHYAAFFLGVPAWVHQQDVRVGLANKLMFPLARKITCALKETKALLPKRAEWIGNPSRDLSVDSIANAYRRLGIPNGAPVIFALGGGTGSASINQLIIDALPHWPREWHVIHLLGRERPHEKNEGAAGIFSNYHVAAFFTDEMKDAYAVASVVISRAGFSTLTELAATKKAAVILPMYRTHQEDNARYFAERGGIVLLGQGTTSGLKLAQVVKELMDNGQMRRELGEELNKLLPRTGLAKISEILQKIA